MRKYDFVRNIYSKEIGDKIKGFLPNTIIEALKSDPDKILWMVFKKLYGI